MEEQSEVEEVATVHSLDALRNNIHGESEQAKADPEPTLWETASAAIDEAAGFLDNLADGKAELVNNEHELVAVVGALVEGLAAYAHLYRNLVGDLDRVSTDFRSYINGAVQSGHVA